MFSHSISQVLSCKRTVVRREVVAGRSSFRFFLTPHSVYQPQLRETPVVRKEKWIEALHLTSLSSK